MDTLITSSNGDKKNHVPNKNNEYTSHENKEAEIVQPVQINIYKSNTNRKLLTTS